jgi:hypothetical protein
MHAVWKSILPHCANSSDFKEEAVIDKITNIGTELGFDGIQYDNVRELLSPHLENLTDDLLLDQQSI